ncbi:MAG: hydrogenase maturation protease [Elusimicrobiota bacterium]
MASKKRTLVLGIGNQILSDDSVGIKVAAGLKKAAVPAEVRELTATGISLLDEMDGYEKLVIIDSIKTGDNPPGTLIKLSIEDLDYAVNLSTCHNVNLPTAILLGRKLNRKMPGDISIYAVEIMDNNTYSEECTPLVEASIPSVVAQIIKEQFSA